MKLTDDMVLKVVTSDGSNALYRAVQDKFGQPVAKEIRIGDMPEEGKQVAQRLVDILESGIVTEKQNGSSSGFSIETGEQIICNVPSFKAFPKEAEELRILIFRNGVPVRHIPEETFELNGLPSNKDAANTQLTDNMVLKVFTSGGISGLEEARQIRSGRGAREIRVGDMPEEGKQAAQRLITALESGTVTPAKNIGDSGFSIKLDEKTLCNMRPFRPVLKEAEELRSLIYRKGLPSVKDESLDRFLS